MTTFNRQQWAHMDAGSRRHLRWAYRMMRHDLPRETARMCLGAALNAGYLSGVRTGTNV